MGECCWRLLLEEDGETVGVHDTSKMSSDSKVLQTNFCASLALGEVSADFGM